MAEKIGNKLIVGFITYGDNTAKYLPYFLPSLKNQSLKDFKILAVDNMDVGKQDNYNYIKDNYPEIDIDAVGENLGFAKAYNRMIKKAINYGAEYFLAINPDIILEPEAIEKMFNEIESSNQLGSVCPKILKWEFEYNKKTNIVDSLGIKLMPGLRFVDLGQGEIDKGQFGKENILGPSGACALYKIEALKKVANNSQYFDEVFFMYKEDCDLAYRLNLAGLKSRCVVDAVVYHDRTVSGKGEGNLSIALNRRKKKPPGKKMVVCEPADYSL